MRASAHFGSLPALRSMQVSHLNMITPSGSKDLQGCKLISTMRSVLSDLHIQHARLVAAQISRTLDIAHCIWRVLTDKA